MWFEPFLNSWPLMTFLIAVAGFLVFRTPVTKLIATVRKVKFGDKSVELGDVAADQQKQLPPPPSPDVSAPLGMPPPNDLYEPIERDIKAALGQTTAAEEVKTAMLIRAIAVARTERAHERAYRLILGSQLEFLLKANSASPPDEARAREIYDRAALSYPEFFVSFSYDTWIRFPVTAMLVQRATMNDVPIYEITNAGRDFLLYLVHNGLTDNKFG